MEEAVKSKDNIKLANSVFKKFNRYKLTRDEKHEIFLDAVWYTIQKWDSSKSAFQTYLCNNIWYKTSTFIKKKFKNKEKTNFQFSKLFAQPIESPMDFENITARLHDMYKIPLIQKFVYGMTIAEIGAENGYDKSYAAKMIKNGLENLKKSV